MSYTVDISPDARIELSNYLDGAAEFGQDTVAECLDAFDDCISLLEKMPNSGFDKLRFIPAKYKVVHLWKHYWMIFQIYEDIQTVKVEYVIDDRQNYGSFVH